jgi:hypothetical protein
MNNTAVLYSLQNNDECYQKNSEKSAEELVSMAKNNKLTSIDGENIEKAVSLIRWVFKRLEHLKIYGGKNLSPLDKSEHLLKVFQTSSAPSFNQLFEHHHHDQKLSILSKGIQKTTSIAQILVEIVQSLYREEDRRGKKRKRILTCKVVITKLTLPTQWLITIFNILNG